jgi:hypothetical protein
MFEGQVTSGNLPRVSRLACFGLTTQNTRRLVHFFIHAFNCREIAEDWRSGSALGQSMRDSGGAHRTQLALGESVIEIIEFDKPGRPYLPDLSPLDNEFQHFAIVVNDMARALERLSTRRDGLPFPTPARSVFRKAPEASPPSNFAIPMGIRLNS